MDKEQKAQVIEEIAARLNEAEALFAIDYRGISVPQAAELRGKLRDADASFNVVKNRLAKRAAEQAGQEGLEEMLDGPTALTYVRGDVVTAAKAIATFNREHDVLEYRGGLMDGAPLDVDSFKAIAKLPGLDVLHGQLVGLAASPLTGLVAGMNNLIAGLGRQLALIAEQGLVGEPEQTQADPAAPGREAEEADGPESGEPEAPVEEPTPAEEPAPDDAPVEEPPAEEPAPEPEAEAEETSEDVEADNKPPDEVEAEGETSEGQEVEGEAETSEGEKED